MSLRAPVAEFIGTFFLCFAGIGAILSNTPAVGGGLGIVGIALAHGLALSIGVATFGGVSGAHLNPAVSIGMLATKRISPANTVIYIVAQLLGATAAAAICKATFPADAIAAANLGIPLPAAWATPGVVLGLEFVMTFLLMTSIFGVAVDERGKAVKIGGFAIGLTVAFDILAGGSITGASMNPARSFGPALVQGYWAWNECYWIGPVAGAVVAALIYDRVILERLPKT